MHQYGGAAPGVGVISWRVHRCGGAALSGNVGVCGRVWNEFVKQVHLYGRAASVDGKVAGTPRRWLCRWWGSEVLSRCTEGEVRKKLHG